MDSTVTASSTAQHTRWNRRLVGQIAALLVAAITADTVIVLPLIVLPQMLEHFHTNQAAWVSATAMLAGAMWAPLLSKSADIHGKRRMLTTALFLACIGAWICIVAPTLSVFVLGRVLQGAATAAVFLNVAIVRELCAPTIAMPAVGAVTTGAGVVGIAMAATIEPLAAEFGFPIVFVVSAAFALVAITLVRAIVPESRFRAPGRVDITGTLLLGTGLVALLGYISLGSDVGWFSAFGLLLLGGGAATLISWHRRSRRIADPVIDLGSLGRPMALTLLVVVLASGAVQSMDQLISLIAQVSPAQQLGYGLDATGSLVLLLGLPALGITVGGMCSGWLAARTDPAIALAAGVLAGVAGAAGMFFGASSFYAAIAFAFVLNVSMGALLASGFNMAGVLAPAHRQGVTAGMVTVVSAIGSVVVSFIGAAVLSSTSEVVNGVAVSSATGVFSYIALATGLLAVAAALSCSLVAQRRRTTRLT